MYRKRIFDFNIIDYVMDCTGFFSCYRHFMVSEDLKISIGRIQRALDRIEISAHRFSMQGHGNPLLLNQHAKLKSEVAASISELDKILRSQTLNNQKHHDG